MFHRATGKDASTTNGTHYPPQHRKAGYDKLDNQDLESGTTTDQDTDDKNNKNPRGKVDFKRLILLARPEWGLLALATFSLIVTTLSNLAIPRYAGTQCRHL